MKTYRGAIVRILGDLMLLVVILAVAILALAVLLVRRSHRVPGLRPLRTQGKQSRELSLLDASAKLFPFSILAFSYDSTRVHGRVGLATH